MHFANYSSGPTFSADEGVDLTRLIIYAAASKFIKSPN